MSNENKRKYIVEFDVNKASLNELKSTIREIQKMTVGDFKTASPQGFNSFEEARTELQRIKKLTAEVDKALEDAFNPQLGVPNLTKLTDSIKKIGVDNIARSWDQLGRVGNSATRQLATGLIATNTQLKQSHKLLDEMATSFKNTVKWGISSTAFNTMTNSLSSAWSYAKNLNKVLTDIRIVSDQSAKDMENFAKQAAKAAKELGATTLDYGNAALLYYQQGDSPEAVAEKANLTVKMANVLGASASEVSNYMTAIWNNFDDGSKSLEYYADVLTKLGAATASSAEEISDGLEKFAAVANTVDLSYEYATAALTTITATTRQSADVVGTALKTLFARIQDLELGETLDDGTTLGKYSEALEKVGISLKGQDGQLRSMDDLLDDMGSKWETLTKNQKVALAQTVAGTRQYTQLIALMDNWDVMQQNLTYAREATGSLQEQQDKYMESTEAHLNKLSASAERFMDALIDDNAVNGLIDTLTTVTDLLGNFVEGVGGGTNALFMLGSIGVDVFSRQIANSLSITISNLRRAAEAAQEARTAFQNLNVMDVLWEGEDNTVQRLKKDLLSVESEMNENDIKDVNEKLQKLGAETDALVKANQAVDEAVEQYKQFGGSGPDDIHSEFDLRDTAHFGETFEKVSKDTKELETNMKSLDSAYSNLIQNRDMSSLTDFISKFETGKKNMQEFGEAYKNVFNEGELKEIEDASEQMEQLIFNLKQIKDDKNLSDKERSDAILDALSKDSKSHSSYMSANTRGVETVGNKATNVLNTLGAKGEENYKKIVNASGEARNKLLKDLDDIFKRFKDAKEVRSFVKTLSGMGEVASAVLAFNNIGDIWEDENLSGLEKFAQLTMTISAAIPTFLNGLSDIREGWKTLGDFLKGFGQGFADAFTELTSNQMLEESIDEVEKSQDELNDSISKENSVATAEKLKNDQLQIISNKTVAKSNKDRAKTEKMDKVGDVVDTVTDVAASEGGKKVVKEGIEEAVEKGVAGAAKKSVWNTLKAKVTGIFAGGASGASGVATLGAALGKIALVAGGAAAAIGAVALVVAAVTKEQREAEKKAKELAEAVEKTKTAYEGAASAYRNFQSDLSAFETATKNINELTEGTLEWKAALIDVNEQALKMLETYPQLAAYIDNSKGYISFTQEGYDDVLSSLYARTQVMQTKYTEAKVQQIQFELDQAEKRAAELVDTGKLRSGVKLAQATPEMLERGDIIRSEETARAIVNAFKGNEGLLYDQSPDATDKIINLLKKNNIDLTYATKESQKAFVSDLQSNAKGLSDFTTSIDGYTTQIGAYTRALLNQSDIPKGATSLEYFVSYEKTKDSLESSYLTNLKTEYGYNKNKKVKDSDKQTKLINEYAEKILGYDIHDENYYQKNKLGSKKFAVGTSKENAEVITYEKALKELALYYAEKDIASGKADTKIQKNSIRQTENANKTITNLNETNKKIEDSFKDKASGISGIEWVDLNSNSTFDPGEHFWKINDEKQKELDKRLKAAQAKSKDEAKKEANAYHQQLLLWRNNKSKNAQKNFDRVLKEATEKGYHYDPSGKGSITNLTPDLKLIEDTYKQEVYADYNKYLIKKGVPTGLNTMHVHTDTTTGKVTLPTEVHPEWTEFAKWMDDLFQERDVATLYDAHENALYRQMLEQFQANKGDDWKYYSKTINGKDIKTYADSEIAAGNKLTEAERKEQERIETNRIYQEDMENTAEALSVSQESFKAYCDQIQEDNAKLQEYGRTQREVNDITISAAKAHFEFAQELDKVNEAVQDNDELLRSWAKSGIHDLNELDPNDAKKIGAVVEAMQGMFGEEVDTDWVQQRVEKIIKLANGDMSVYDDLQKDYVKLKVKGIEIDPEGEAKLSDTDKEKVKNDLSKSMDIFLKELDTENLEIGAEIDMDTQPFLLALGHMVQEGKLTEQQLSGIFGELGFDLVWETRKEPDNAVTQWLKDHFGWDVPGNWGKTITVPKIIWKDANKKTYTPSVPPTTGSGSSKASKVNKTEDAFNRYHDVDTELKKISNRMEEVQRTTDRSTGSQWIDNLKEQFSLLNQEISTTEEKLKIAEGELAELQGKLAKEGAIFGEDGTLLNYKEIYYDALNELNAAENKMNSFSSADAQDKYRPTYEAAQERYDKIVELISRYDEVFLDLIPGLQKTINEKIDEQTQIKIDVFNKEIEIRLEMADFERNWRDFKRTVIDGIKEDDILGNLKADLDQFGIYYDEFGKGTIQKLTDQVQKDMEQLAQFEAGENMSIYNDFSATQLEDMRAHIESLMSEMENFYELTERIRESYLNMMDEAKEKFDEQIEKYGQVASLLEHDLNLISMIYGEDAYSDMAQYYDQIHENNLNSLDMLRMEADFWAEEMKKHDKNSEEYKKAEENWTSVVSELTSKTEESITNIQNRFTNAVEAIFQKLNDEVTAGKGLDYLSKQWELVNQNADMYLDNMNGIYEIQKLQNKYQEAIDSNDGLKVQKELKTIMDEELKALREKDKLTQYDVDRAELRYQIALKQIALEEAQQNKSKMRLRRDSQGNYTYQYTADEEQVNNLQSEMTDLYQQLYNLDANQYKNNLDQLYSVWVQFQEDMKAAEAINDEKEKQERKKMLTEQYGKMINNLVAQDEEIKKNLYESTMSGLLDLYDSNAENYNNMTVEQQEILNNFLNEQGELTGTAYNNLFKLYEDGVSEFREMADSQKEILVSSMLPTWNTTLADMARAFAEKGGFTEVCKNAFKELDDANKAYQLGLKDIETKAGTSFEEVKKGYDKNTAAAKLLVAENGKLIQTYKDNLTEIAKLIKDMDNLILKYAAAAEAAKAYGEAAYEAWKKAQGDDADDAHDDADKILNPEPEPEPDPKPQPEPQKPKEITVKGKVKTSPNTPIYDYAGDTSGEYQYYDEDPNYTVLEIDGDWVKVRYHKLSSGVSGWFKKKDLTAYDTGGYTGDWGSNNGRLAMLHQKELVLNAHDTKNMLNAIRIVRTITDNLGVSLLNRMGAIAANTGSGLLGNSDALEQIVHIDAQFPNVTNSSEIEDALNNLVNRAAQHITKN